jgi:site-specific DNA recombinase
MPTAIIYVRLSSYSGELDTTTSPARQEEECRQWCAVNGYDVIDVVRDLDVSGSDKGLHLDRPGLLRVRARWDDADVLVFAKLDRIARNVLDWTRLAEEAKGHGVALVSVADKLDLTDPKGQFIANVLQSFAQMEAAMISTRLTEAVAFMAREGRHRGGLAAFGWRSAVRQDAPGYRLALDPETAPIVREAVDRTIAGEPTQRIVDDFNQKGVPSPEGKGWANDSLRKLLRRPILRGMQVHQGEIVRGLDGLPIRPHQPLVTDDEWRALQSALEARAHKGGWWRKPPTLLKGIAVCDLCGRKMHNVDQEGKAGFFKCSRHGRTNRCPGVAIHRERLETYVEEVFLALLGDVQVTEEETVEGSSAELLEVEDALDFVAAKLRDVEDEDEEQVLLAQRRTLVAKRKELRALPTEPTVRVIEVGETYGELWSRSDLETRRSLLASIVDEVRVRKGRRGGLPANRQPVRDRVEIIWRGMATAAA